MTRILIVDDHTMIRKGIATVLTHELDGHDVVCDEAVCGGEALAMIDNSAYDLMILDLSMPDMDGLELLGRLKQKGPLLPVLVVSMHSEDQYALRALRAGAAGYLAKEQAADELVAAVSRVLGGSRYISPRISDQLIGHAITGTMPPEPVSHSCLSNREFQVMKRLAGGQIPKCIADDLGISIKTVSTFKKRIFEKMRFSSDADLVVYSMKHGLLD
jgi:two-component system invasion response regulator UvrY